MTIELWIWLVLGLVPYKIKCQRELNGIYTLALQALFWSLCLRQQPGHSTDWTLQLVLIDRLRTAIWAGLLRLREK